MGRQHTSRFYRWLQLSVPMEILVIAGLMLPAAGNAQPAQTLQTQAEAFSQVCLQQTAHVQQTAQLEAAEIAQTVATCQQAVALTQIAGEPRLTAYSLGNLGTLYLQQQDYQSALAFYQQALTLATEIDDQVLVTKSLVALATAHLHLGQSSTALALYQQALVNAQVNNDPAGAAIAHYNLGLIYDMAGQYQQSVDAYQSAALIAQDVNDPILEIYALNKMRLANQALAEVNNQASKGI